jgi:hypothetical protein
MTPEDKIIALIEIFFERYKIRYSKHDHFEEWLLHYFNFLLKYISVIDRQVRISNEIKNSQLSGRYKLAFDTIINKTQRGIDLNPYQSRNSFNSDYDDGLFNDWGIHHLHLSISKKNKTDYFMSRCDKLLFVQFTEAEAYFIGIYEHNEKPIWGKKELIRIIRNNWPDLLKDKEAGAIFEPDLNDYEIEKLREKGYLLGVNVDGIGYMLLGHGQVSSGDNLMACRLSGEVVRWLGQNRKLFYDNEKKFVIELKSKLNMD